MIVIIVKIKIEHNFCINKEHHYKIHYKIIICENNYYLFNKKDYIDCISNILLINNCLKFNINNYVANFIQISFYLIII